MKLTRDVLDALGAKIDPERGGRWFETAACRVLFLSDPAGGEGDWHARVTPLPARDGGPAYCVGTLAELLAAIYKAGQWVGKEDIRRRFRAVMDLAEGDTDTDLEPETPE